MPVSFSFDGQNAATAAGISPGFGPSTATITEVGSDGVIDVGDAVTITGMETPILTTMGVSNGGTLFYQGTVVLDGDLVHLFTAAHPFVTNDTLLGLWEDLGASPFLDAIRLMDVVTGTDTQTFGTDAAMCFAEGTLIATPKGETAVEALRIGDLVRTEDGRAVPVKWIGRQTMLKCFRGARAQLVRIRAGALGNHSDLDVTGDHGMLVEGHIINASALVNGDTIDWVPLSETPDRFTVYHVETENHDVVLANGAPSETYIDVPARRGFDNYQEYLDLCGMERPTPEMSRPRISSSRLVPPRLKELLAACDSKAFKRSA